MPTLFLPLLLLLVTVQSSEFFFSSPNLNNNLGITPATTMKIADDESMIVVGYSNGQVQSFSMQGVLLGNFTGFNTSIYEVMWLSGVGPLVMDINGNVRIYSSNGSQVLMGQIANLNVSELVGTTDVTCLNGNCYFGLIFNQQVREYECKISTGDFLNNRNYSSTTQIIEAYYNSEYN